MAGAADGLRCPSSKQSLPTAIALRNAEPDLGCAGREDLHANDHHWVDVSRRIDAGVRWSLREHGIVLAGPNAPSPIVPIRGREFVDRLIRRRSNERWPSRPMSPSWLDRLMTRFQLCGSRGEVRLVSQKKRECPLSGASGARINHDLGKAAMLKEPVKDMGRAEIEPATLGLRVRLNEPQRAATS
jgi:hypothetical protein